MGSSQMKSAVRTEGKGGEVWRQVDQLARSIKLGSENSRGWGRIGFEMVN